MLVLLLLLILKIWCIGVLARVEPIFYNYYYPWRYNLSSIGSSSAYLPPESTNFMLPEVIDNRARSRSPAVSNADLYPVYQFAKQTANIQHAMSNQVSVSHMSCQNNDDQLYFRASLSSMKNMQQPIIENAGSSSSCKLSKYQNEYRIDFGKDEFWNCGVLDCSTDSDRHYCLKVRFPRITGLRLMDDLLVTLQCTAQRSIAAQTRRISLKTIDTAGRMSARVAAGGHKNAFESDLTLYRKTEAADAEFGSQIQPGGTVILGEELLLRAAVRDGDGWKYSKISEVTVHYVQSRERKKVMNSLWILDAEGCLNTQLAGISLGEQYRVGPLESYLLFRAFRFDGMHDTDQMLLTVKITGCLRGDDCLLNCPAAHVRTARQPTRAKRQIINNQTIDCQNDLTFKVVAASKDSIARPTAFNIILPYCLSIFAIVAFVAGCLSIVQVFTSNKKPCYFYAQ